MNHKAGIKLAVSLATAAAVVLPGLAHAGGFALLEQSARSLGRAHSGGAALVNDASSIFYNPAGLTELTQPQVMGSLTWIDLQADFTKEIAVDAAGRPLSGPEDGGANKPGYVPSLFFGTPLNNGWAFGVGLYAPYGLNTDYPPDSIARYQAIYSGVAGVNLTPTVAWQINDIWSIGLGVDIQYFTAKLTSDIDYGAACFGALDPVTCSSLGLSPQSHDGYFGLSGNDTGYGWNVGVLANFGKTKVGFTYRSSINHDIDGKVRFEAVPALFAAQGLFQDGSASTSIKTPAQASLSFAHELNDRWTISADVTWMGWNSFDAINIDFQNPKQPDTTQPENWQNSWRYSVGVDWHYNDAWTFRGGLAYDQTPIQDQYRTPRLPGDTRKWIALGATWHLSNALDLDIGYAHLFVGDNIPIDQIGQSGDHLVGTYDVATDIVSIGFRYGF
ncbi:MAG TPA: outer membrane protein transport protein [Gammaproteobacteria bacterium]|nr:outer membrane protein transport protein [Gammaproteobacteria bacterium]